MAPAADVAVLCDLMKLATAGHDPAIRARRQFSDGMQSEAFMALARSVVKYSKDAPAPAAGRAGSSAPAPAPKAPAPSQAKEKEKKAACHKCGLVGHFAAQCPQKTAT